MLQDGSVARQRPRNAYGLFTAHELQCERRNGIHASRTDRALTDLVSLRRDADARDQ